MNKPTVAMFNLNETSRDPRVRRVAGSLASLGYKVIVFGMRQEGLAPRESFDNFEIVRVDIPVSRVKKDMEGFKRICPEASEVIQKSDPQILDYECSPHRILLSRVRRRLEKSLNFFPDIGQSGKQKKSFPTELTIMDIRYIMLLNLALYREASRISPSIVHCNDLDTLLCGFMMKTNFKTPLVYDSHEIYAEQPVMCSQLWHDFYTNLENMLINTADGRMTVCDSISNYFLTRYGAAHFVAIRNLPSISLLPPPSILERRNNPRRILYHGAYSIHRGLEEIIDAAKGIKNAEIIFRGFGPEEQLLRKLVKERGVQHTVSFSPPVPVEEIIPQASECDIGLSLFPSVCKNLEYVLPNKFFEYMMAGLALASSNMMEMRKLIIAHDAGVIVDFEKPEHLAGELNDLISNSDRLDHYRHNAYEAARSELHWEQEEKKLFELYRNLS
ncbi:MAG: glycosyltransferase [Candidatus Xenobiia bacterium LiM19]